MNTVDFVFPPSVQSDLFSYLKADDREMMRMVLRPFKKHAQATICSHLLDYLETGRMVSPDSDLAVNAAFKFCCHFLTPINTFAK